MSSIKGIRERLNQLQGEKMVLQRQITFGKQSVIDLSKSIRQHEQAREIIRMVGKKTQEQLQYHIGNITTLALNAVFDDPYELVMQFVERRNKIECDLLFKKGEELQDPMDSSGYGALDIASFALRIASWAMQNPKSRKVIILDEPMRFLSLDHHEKASQMIKQLSEKLGLQFIMVTHSETLASNADAVFRVTMKNRKSTITKT